MAHQIEARDRQTGLEQAWHKKTQIVEVVTRDNSMPWDVEIKPLTFRNQFLEEVDSGHKILVANDDGLPIGLPFQDSYCPSNINQFWDVISEGLKGVDYKVVSAGSVANRQKIFASIKLDEGFVLGDRIFRQYLTIIDSFDKSTTFQCRYSNICVVCANTFGMVMNDGEQVGKAKHTPNLAVFIERLKESIQSFTGYSEKVKTRMESAAMNKLDEETARFWFAGIEGRNMKVTSNALKQKVARQVELFKSGRGNRGETLLDAFQALTEFHTHESSNRTDADAQYMSSEWGTSANVKTAAFQNLFTDFERNVDHGKRLLVA
jgi:hypothetical protein